MNPFHWLRSPRPSVPDARYCRPCLEELEDRSTPSDYAVTGTGDLPSFAGPVNADPGPGADTILVSQQAFGGSQGPVLCAPPSGSSLPIDLLFSGSGDEVFAPANEVFSQFPGLEGLSLSAFLPAPFSSGGPGTT